MATFITRFYSRNRRHRCTVNVTHDDLTKHLITIAPQFGGPLYLWLTDEGKLHLEFDAQVDTENLTLSDEDPQIFILAELMEGNNGD